MSDTKTRTDLPEPIGSILTRLRLGAEAGKLFGIGVPGDDISQVITEYREAFPGVDDETLIRFCDHEAALLVSAMDSVLSGMASASLASAVGVQIAEAGGLG